MKKIAIFYPHNFLAGWRNLGGFRETLIRMGHEVLDCALPGNAVTAIDQVRPKMPTIAQLNGCEVVISFQHEYTQPWLAALYGYEAWSKLTIPIVARFDESQDRMDLGLPKRTPELMKWGSHWSFPGAQDAEKYKGQWLPFAADVMIFHPEPVRIANAARCEKKYDIGFVGSLYPERRKYLEQLSQFIDSRLTFHCGNAIVQDLGGIRERESTELLAENYRQIKVFFCLPPASRLLIEKIFEVMATGTCVFYPRLFGEAAKNLTIFEDNVHIVYYDVGYFVNNAKQVGYFLTHDEEREEIAQAGCKLVHEKYTLEAQMQKLLDLALGNGQNSPR